MTTLLSLGNDTTVLYTSTPEERRAAAWELAIALVMDHIEATEWEAEATREPMSTPHKKHWVTRKIRTY